MTRRLKRTSEYEIVLQIKDDGFIRPPRDAQRNWILNRSLKDFSDDLEFLNKQARKMARGNDQVDLSDRTQRELSDDQIMEDWQIPLMEAMAKACTVPGGDVLEIGFGRGVASDFIQQIGVQSHTVVECNDSLVQRYEDWKSGFFDCTFRLIHARWQDAVDQFEMYDAIFFHTYPLDEEEHMEYVVKSVTFAEHFFEIAARHLRPGGMFTYMTNEADSLSRAHQRLLCRHFSAFGQRIVGPLDVSDSKDALWGDTMVVVNAIK